MRARPAGSDVITGEARPGADTIELETYRRELTGYCYRMLGSGFEAEDAVQDTMVRAWKGIDRFEGRSALRSWLYRIATNVCLDMLQGPQRRARPMEMGPASTADTPIEGGAEEQELLARYVDAFERYDITSLASLLHDDVIQSMPPYALWLQGPAEVGNWMLGQGSGCRGSRLLATAANGRAAFGSYRPA